MKMMTMIMMIFMVAFMQMQTSIAQTRHVVGDALGWTIPTGDAYTTWASQQTFNVGDTLFFNFTTGNHDVAEVSEAAYDPCTIAGPISITTNGPATISLTTAGAHYYICTFGTHCQIGQKLQINVSAASTTTPPPAPTPTTSPPTITTPPPATTPTTSPSTTTTPPTATTPSPAPVPSTSTIIPPPTSSPAPSRVPSSGPSPSERTTPSPAGDTTPSQPSPSTAARSFTAVVPATFLAVVLAFFY